MSTNEELTYDLSQLLLACEDCEAGLLNAAQNETTEQLQSLYRQYSEEMIKCISELETEIKQLGGDLTKIKERVDEDTSLALRNPEPQSLIQKALALYNEALDQPWPEEIQGILNRHFTLLQEAEDHLAEVQNMTTERTSDADSDTLDSRAESETEGSIAPDIQPRIPRKK